MLRQSKVFVSHTTRDQRDYSLAHKLADGLRELGAQVWIAPDDIPIGADWEQSIVSAVMDQCTHFLVILSAASTTAEWVLKEIELARERREHDACYTILPLAVGKVGDYVGRDFIDRFQLIPYYADFPSQLDVIAKSLNLRPGVPDRYTELTEGFVGRHYVFSAIEDFIANHENGCFTVVGDPGEGKSAILAEYVRRTGSVAHFNLRAEGINRTEQCLKSIKAQLAARYALPDGLTPADPLEFSRHWEELLKQAASQLNEGDRLVIVIDALDEVDITGHPSGTNILFLPRYLPKNVFFLMARRRVDIPFINAAPQEDFNLLEHRTDSLRDIKIYIRNAVQREQLQHWIQTQRLQSDWLVNKLADKSECNFMYLHYVLPEIENGAYKDLSIEKLPKGLQGYYEDHWNRMGMKTDPLPRKKIRIVYVLAEVRRPVSRQLISDFSRQDPLFVQQVIDEWQQFLHAHSEDGQTQYSIYHTSFIDFLHRKDIVQAAGETIEGIHAAIADDLWQGLMGSE